MKKTAIAPSNIAFIKYWGKKDEILRLPANGSVSVNQSNIHTTTTVEFSDVYKNDEVIINGKENKDECLRAIRHLDRIRKMAGISLKAKVVSKNNFPTASGLASSASGFAALTVAGASAAGLQLSEKELSILARLGSGSACRSIPDGFVEWLDGNSSETSYAVSIFPAKYWDLSIFVVIFNEEKKEVLTSDGQKIAYTSPFYISRLNHMKNKMILAKKCIKEKNFIKFGELFESEALELHAITLTSQPSLIYWGPNTITIMKQVKKWRNEGVSAYFTIDTGQHLHIICEKKDEVNVLRRLKTISGTHNIIINKPSKGTQLTEDHLF